MSDRSFEIGSRVAVAVLVVLALACAYDARRAHMADESLPATCTIYGTSVEPRGVHEFDPVIRFQATANETPVGRFIMPLEPKGETPERAKAIADNQWRHQPSFACWYHPHDRDYLTIHPHGRYLLPAVCAVAFLVLALGLALAIRWWGPRPRPGPVHAGRWSGKDRFHRLYRAREFLPEDPPPDWGTIYVRRDDDGWMFDAGSQGVLARLEHEGSMWALRVLITSRGSELPPDDARCSEILHHLQGVGEFLECDGLGDQPGTRVWLALPRDMRPRWTRLPEGAAVPPAAAALNRRLESARRHFPIRLPKGWSVPVAVTEPHGTAWKDGAWMFGADDVIAMVNLWVVDGRTKLFVGLFRRDGSDVGEAEALDVLRHFRDVHEFSQGERSAEAPYIAYLGEIEPRSRDLATLN
jgi:hypothetical protein